MHHPTTMPSRSQQSGQQQFLLFASQQTPPALCQPLALTGIRYPSEQSKIGMTYLNADHVKA